MSSKPGRVVSEATKAKISASNRATRAGRPVSEETRAKLVAAAQKRRIEQPVSEETRRKQSLAHKGKTLSEEHKAKISASCKGKPVSEETRAKLSAANKGRAVPLERRQKLSESQKGRKFTPEHCAAISAGLQARVETLGFHHTPETREKLSKALTGRVTSEATKQKMRDTWAAKRAAKQKGNVDDGIATAPRKRGRPKKSGTSGTIIAPTQKQGSHARNKG